ncbi:hypothetical protein T484DRAFT_1748124 [Baffinella frigidus]|nr:hypothetical protein T484DRAFT_1748124 [Cryptophyta sp. CCMP2293]
MRNLKLKLNVDSIDYELVSACQQRSAKLPSKIIIFPKVWSLWSPLSTSRTNTMVTHATTSDHLSNNTPPAHRALDSCGHRALEFCGVEDESARLKQRHSYSVLGLPVGVTVVSCCSSTSTSSSVYARSPSLSKAVREWEAGRERRAMVASNPLRSFVVSAYFWQELSSLSKQAAAQ